MSPLNSLAFKLVYRKKRWVNEMSIMSISFEHECQKTKIRDILISPVEKQNI